VNSDPEPVTGIVILNNRNAVHRANALPDSPFYQKCMTVPDLLKYVSVLIESITAVIAIVIVTKKQKTYGWLIAFTFIL
jgi:hypothetical protein